MIRKYLSMFNDFYFSIATTLLGASHYQMIITETITNKLPKLILFCYKWRRMFMFMSYFVRVTRLNLTWPTPGNNRLQVIDSTTAAFYPG